MRWKNSRGEYGHIAVSLHWLVALAVYGMFALGLWMVTLGYYDTGITKRLSCIKVSAWCCLPS